MTPAARRRAVAVLIHDGYENKEIAYVFGITERQAKRDVEYWARLYDAENRVGVAIAVAAWPDEDIADGRRVALFAQRARRRATARAARPVRDETLWPAE